MYYIRDPTKPNSLSNSPPTRPPKKPPPERTTPLFQLESAPPVPNIEAAYVPQVGERVKHKAFGCGTVLTVKPVGPDKMLEIAFDGSGTKKLMLSAAARFLQKE